MRLFNTLTNKKEEFKPIEEGKVSIYICGPTVYNHAHIGNTRPMIVFDVLRRTFEYLGNDVTFVSNYTDVDDKIIKAAKAEGITEKELTDKYIKAYEDVRAGLNIEDPTYKPRVTETMPEIIDFIQALIDKGYAYEVDGDVYFRVTKVKEYRNPLNMTDDVIAGVRKEVSKVENATKNASLYLQVNHVPAHDYKKETVDAMVNALEDDLNTSLALTQVLDQVKVLNQVMRVREKDNDVIATEYATLVKMGDVLGFLFEGTKLSEEDIALYEQWNAYKKEKNFDEADRVRKELTERGIL